ncbi:MAG TPA: hypothetical protein VJ779_07400 [Acetobacteraceae bacterium]|nr:hypothetical protein [Acetobacteraceae bacterium]
MGRGPHARIRDLSLGTREKIRDFGWMRGDVVSRRGRTAMALCRPLLASVSFVHAESGQPAKRQNSRRNGNPAL